MLVPHSDESTARFKPGEWEEAQEWVFEYYRKAAGRPDDAALEKIKAALNVK